MCILVLLFCLLPYLFGGAIEAVAATGDAFIFTGIVTTAVVMPVIIDAVVVVVAVINKVIVVVVVVVVFVVIIVVVIVIIFLILIFTFIRLLVLDIVIAIVILFHLLQLPAFGSRGTAIEAKSPHSVKRIVIDRYLVPPPSLPALPLVSCSTATAALVLVLAALWQASWTTKGKSGVIDIDNNILGGGGGGGRMQLSIFSFLFTIVIPKPKKKQEKIIATFY